MDRRTFLALPAPAALLAFVAGRAACGSREFVAAREALIALPGRKSFEIEATAGKAVLWRAADHPNDPLFVGSAIKTFILAEFLREVEKGRLSEDELLPIDDSVRSLSSPVFGASPREAKNFTGVQSVRAVLEAMIAHSDNTATDAALKRVGVAKVRAFIASAGLAATRIPGSTRLMLSYLAGAPHGVDEGWKGMKEIIAGRLFGAPRSPINNRETMISTASELVSYYQRALAGKFFAKSQTLAEFKRIEALADLIPRVVPPGIAAYAKGGSIDWRDFHALCAPGQMVVGQTAITFCFTINWRGPDGAAPKVVGGFAKSVAAMLSAAAKCFG